MCVYCWFLGCLRGLGRGACGVLWGGGQGGRDAAFAGGDGHGVEEWDEHVALAREEPRGGYAVGGDHGEYPVEVEVCHVWVFALGVEVSFVDAVQLAVGLDAADRAPGDNDLQSLVEASDNFFINFCIHIE